MRACRHKHWPFLKAIAHSCLEHLSWETLMSLDWLWVTQCDGHCCRAGLLWLHAVLFTSGSNPLYFLSAHSCPRWASWSSVRVSCLDVLCGRWHAARLESYELIRVPFMLAIQILWVKMTTSIILVLSKNWIEQGNWLRCTSCSCRVKKRLFFHYISSWPVLPKISTLIDLSVSQARCNESHSLWPYIFVVQLSLFSFKVIFDRAACWSSRKSWHTGRSYPALFWSILSSCCSVAYWEPAKFTAKLREAKTDKNLLLFKCDMGAGHFSQSGRFDRLHDVALEQAFLLKAVNMKRSWEIPLLLCLKFMRVCAYVSEMSVIV